MNHAEAIEGFEVAIAALLEKISICEFYFEIYVGASLSSQSTINSQKIQSMMDSALPELYAAVIVFASKASTYFRARGTYIILRTQYINTISKLKLGIKKLAKMLQPFDLEFQPCINEIDAKEAAIREYADAVTMKRIRGNYTFIHAVGYDRGILTQAYRH